MFSRFVYWLNGAISSDDDGTENGTSFAREMEQSSSTYFWSNYTDKSGDTDDFTSNLTPAADVSVDTVITSIYLNSVAFVVLMTSYEILRRLFPAVYSSQIKRQFKAGLENDDKHPEGYPAVPPTPTNDNEMPFLPFERQRRNGRAHTRESSIGVASLPDVMSPFYWVPSVFDVPWSQVRRVAGLDGYFFLRFIRMNCRITAVTTFWAAIILVPVYATGEYQNGEEGWYHMSIANVIRGSWRMWVPCCFAYLLTGFIFFVMKQEYRHFLDLRMDFLARGASKVNPQHHYSLKVENIPYELRSEKALFDYFNKLFPGKVHSTTVVLNLPDLESVKTRCLRVCRRLEKSIAFYHATGKLATHNVGSPRINMLGIDLAPFDWSCGSYPKVAYVDNRLGNAKPSRGIHVDSISYYTHDLAASNQEMYFMQQRKSEIAITGNSSFEADNWLSRVMHSAFEVADRIMVDSAEDNSLRTAYNSFDDSGAAVPQAEQMSSRYGSFGPVSDVSPRIAQCRHPTPLHPLDERADESLDKLNGSNMNPLESPPLVKTTSQASMDRALYKEDYVVPGTTDHSSMARRIAGRLGLDFVVTGVKFFNRQLDSALESVVGATMSSTGFVTFLDLTSVTCAASAPLTSKPQILDVSVAPEPRDVIWANAHVSDRSRARSERFVNFVFSLGVFFWIFPLAAIQAFAKAEFIARIPGMEWILTFDGGSVTSFMNGYLPVVALLCLILILPVIFQLVALKYERRKTHSDVHRSMLSRYFYYQLVNIYISVTAGSLWRSLAEILDHPSSLFQLLGESLPSMVGYFVALLVTKVLAGLPIVFLRIGALSRMLFLRAITSKDKLTQRELDEIYRPENVQYGWEFPSQLLVIVIVFTYAVICPIILPVGMLYFVGSLIVYKKQVLYVYQPVYESGGAMFPSALQRTLFGLVCGQMTLIGYLITRGCYYQPIFTLPLPVATIWGMGYFRRHYADPSTRLSLERAREYDRVSELVGDKPSEGEQVNESGASPCGIEARRAQFDKWAYRQPVLTQEPMLPRRYRRGQEDPMTEECRMQLRRINDYSLMNDTGRGFHYGISKEVSTEHENIPQTAV